MCDLQSLIERVEKAGGPDQELDEAIAVSLGIYAREKRGRDRQEWFYRIGGEDYERRSTARYAGTDGLPRYTESLDAVMALMPEGYAIDGLSVWVGCPATCTVKEAHKETDGGYWHSSRHGMWSAVAATPALAILSAILKSRLATNGGVSA